MSHITTHVLDASAGRPAAGISVELAGRSGQDWEAIATGVTNDDGRVAELGPEKLEPGLYRLTFATEPYFEQQGVATFYPEVTVTFGVREGEPHYHVPVLLSPFAYSTYRGS